LSHEALCVAVNFKMVGEELTGKDFEGTVRGIILEFRLKA
jgi:hypothetical protein